MAGESSESCGLTWRLGVERVGWLAGLGGDRDRVVRDIVDQNN